MFDIYVVNECLKLPSNINNYTAACLPGSILNQDHQPEFKCFKNNRH